MNLNEAYETYRQDPIGGKEIFGEVLLKYCQKFFYKNVGDVAGVSARSSGQTMEDSLGDAVLEIWERIPKYDAEKASFTTWVTLILKNAFVDGYKAHAQRAEIAYTDNGMVHPHRSIDDKLTLKQATKCLTRDEKEFMKMKFAGFSDEAIATHFSKDLFWAWNKWHRMKNKMKVFVSEKG
jgi:RNA polymerase sigma factor (sigma-70 family)